MERTRGDQYKGCLEVGQRVHCILYGGKDGVISAIEGQQDPDSIRSLGGGMVTGGRANVRVAFEDHLSGVPEAIIRGVQWYIYNKIEPREVIDQTIEKARIAREEKERKAKEASEARTQRRADLPAQYPYLTPTNEQMKYRGHALGAKNLRIELKRAFPSVKFSVTSKSYSGGNSIDIYWTDGPLTEDVEKISNKYREGSFDGMTDCYNDNHENVWPNVFGGAKYVMAQRYESPALILKVAQSMGFKIDSGESDNMGNLPGLDYETSRMIYREARKTRA
jgi:hypothetical protein